MNSAKYPNISVPNQSFPRQASQTINCKEHQCFEEEMCITFSWLKKRTRLNSWTCLYFLSHLYTISLYVIKIQLFACVTLTFLLLSMRGANNSGQHCTINYTINMKDRKPCISSFPKRSSHWHCSLLHNLITTAIKVKYWCNLSQVLCHRLEFVASFEESVSNLSHYSSLLSLAYFSWKLAE